MTLHMTWWDTFQYILYTVLIVAGIYALSKLSDKLIVKLSMRFNPNAIHWRFMKQMVKFLVTVLGLLLLVDIIPVLNQFSTSLVAGSAIVIAAVSLAAQGSLSNIIGGVFISLFKPFAVGDRVRLVGSNITGTVKDINFRHTVIATPQNSHIIVPNSILNNEIIENSNIYGDRICNFLDFKVQYGSDMALVKSIVEKGVIEHPFHVDTRNESEKESGAPIVTVFVRDIHDGGIDMRVGVWTEDIGKNFRMCSDVREYLLQEFAKNDIQFACVRVKQV